jgi:hypothetical protein
LSELSSNFNKLRLLILSGGFLGCDSILVWLDTDISEKYNEPILNLETGGSYVL